MADIHAETFSQEWDLPYDNARAMLIYTTLQELATRVHYVRLRDVVRREGGCPALEKVLTLVAIDEAAHADFFAKLVGVYLTYDRAATLEQMRRVVNTFRMPAVHMLSDSRKRMSEVKELRIFDEDIFIESVLTPVLTKLGVTRAELRRKTPRESTTTGLG